VSAVSEALVREYFELHGFLVRQQRKHLARAAEEDEEIDFFVWNPQSEDRLGAAPFILNSSNLRAITRGIVAVKGWHTEKFSPAVLAREPELARFAEPKFLKLANQFFGDGEPLTKILVLSELPQSEALRERSVAVLREKGVDAVIPFRTILTELIAAVEVKRNYSKSDPLQLIRILKNYDLFKEAQLELFKAKRRRK